MALVLPLLHRARSSRAYRDGHLECMLHRPCSWFPGLELSAQEAPSLLPGHTWTSVLSRHPAQPGVGIFRDVQGMVVCKVGAVSLSMHVRPPLVWDAVECEQWGLDCQPGSCISTLAPGRAIVKVGLVCPAGLRL